MIGLSLNVAHKQRVGRKKTTPVEKNKQIHLHVVMCEVWLCIFNSILNSFLGYSRRWNMRRLLVILSLTIATVTTGCNSCGRPFLRFWDRGDSCRTCADGNCDTHSVMHEGMVSDGYTPGLLGSPIMGDVAAPRGASELLPHPAGS
jgi:hypothetical protein